MSANPWLFVNRAFSSGRRVSPPIVVVGQQQQLVQMREIVTSRGKVSLQIESDRHAELHARPGQFRRRRGEGLRAAQERQRLFIERACSR
jgi:hypothetical protein